MGPITDRSSASANLQEIATIATRFAADLATINVVDVVRDALAPVPNGFDLDALRVAMRGIAAVPSYRQLVDAKLAEVDAMILAGTLLKDITPQHRANARAAADALDLALQPLRNFDQAMADAQGDLQ